MTDAGFLCSGCGNGFPRLILPVMRWTRAATFIVLAVPVLFGGCPAPTYDAWKLQGVEAEAKRLMEAYPANPAWASDPVQRSEWPPVIASLDPEIVIVHRGWVYVMTEPFMDGGWGYEVVSDKEDLRMPPGCYMELRQRLYWRSPC